LENIKIMKWIYHIIKNICLCNNITSVDIMQKYTFGWTVISTLQKTALSSSFWVPLSATIAWFSKSLTVESSRAEVSAFQTWVFASWQRFMCFLNKSALAKSFEQCVHGARTRSTSCFAATWAFRLSFLVELYSQLGHWCRFWPVSACFDFLWLINVVDSVHINSHWSHM